MRAMYLSASAVAVSTWGAISSARPLRIASPANRHNCAVCHVLAAASLVDGYCLITRVSTMTDEWGTRLSQYWRSHIPQNVLRAPHAPPPIGRLCPFHGGLRRKPVVTFGSVCTYVSVYGEMKIDTVMFSFHYCEPSDWLRRLGVFHQSRDWLGWWQLIELNLPSL